MITISLCMIVRDEEKPLERCLKSVKGIPDEIIIVDTGSNDKTKEIASKFTPHVLDFLWMDDFSAARNYSFDHAKMDYILWLDADDLLLPKERKKLLELKKSLNPNIEAVSMLYHTAFDDSSNVITSVRRLRLVKRSKNFVWVGVVHEDLVADDEYNYLDSDIVITHKNESKEAGPSKRNLDIYEKHLKKEKKMIPSDLFHYARELHMNKDYHKAIKYYLQFLECKEKDIELILFTLHKLASCYYHIGDLEKEWDCTLKSLEVDTPRPEFSCRFGERFIHKNQFHQAIFWYKLALEDPRGSLNKWAIENQPFKTWLPHKQLGLCYYQIGNYERSLYHNKMALNYLPEDKDIKTNIEYLESVVTNSTKKSNVLLTTHKDNHYF